MADVVVSWSGAEAELTQPLGSKLSAVDRQTAASGLSGGALEPSTCAIEPQEPSAGCATGLSKTAEAPGDDSSAARSRSMMSS